MNMFCLTEFTPGFFLKKIKGMAMKLGGFIVHQNCLSAVITLYDAKIVLKIRMGATLYQTSCISIILEKRQN